MRWSLILLSQVNEVVLKVMMISTSSVTLTILSLTTCKEWLITLICSKVSERFEACVAEPFITPHSDYLRLLSASKRL